MIASPAKSNLATVSVVVGVVSLICLIFIPGLSLLLGLVAVLLGWMALNEINSKGLAGRNLAIGGIACGALGIVGWFVMVFILGPMIADTFNKINQSLSAP